MADLSCAAAKLKSFAALLQCAVARLNCSPGDLDSLATHLNSCLVDLEFGFPHLKPRLASLVFHFRVLKLSLPSLRSSPASLNPWPPSLQSYPTAVKHLQQAAWIRLRLEFALTLRMATKAQFPEEQADSGEFERQEDAFRDWVSKDGSTPYPAVAGRYHLYISLACPWASRTLIVRHLKSLEAAIGVTVVDPIRDELGWAFRDGPGFSTDPVNGFKFLSEAYRATDPRFHGRVTVPVLWDKQTRRIVNNSEDDICRMFNDAFSTPGRGDVDLFPRGLEPEHAELAQFIYEKVNNGVYQAGFATGQKPYEKAFRALFAALDQLEARLGTRRYLFGPNRISVQKSRQSASTGFGPNR